MFNVFHKDDTESERKTPVEDMLEQQGMQNEPEAQGDDEMESELKGKMKEEETAKEENREYEEKIKRHEKEDPKHWSFHV